MILDFFQNQGKRGYYNALMKYWGNSIFVLFAHLRLLRIISLLFTIVHFADTVILTTTLSKNNNWFKAAVIYFDLGKIYNFNIKTVTVFLKVEKNVISKSFFYHINVCIFDKSAVISHNNLNFENLRCHNRDPVDAILHEILLNNNLWFHGDSKFYFIKDTVVWSS